jgi:hypothetical protein
MKALSLTQPWAHLVMLGAKQWETRSWRAFHRGDVAIHAAKGYPRWARELEDEEPFCSALIVNGEFTHPAASCGHIIAVARLVDVAPTSAFNAIAPLPAYVISEQERAFGDYGYGRHAFKLEDVRRLKPIACKGALGFWTVPADIEQAIREELAA